MRNFECAVSTGARLRTGLTYNHAKSHTTHQAKKIVQKTHSNASLQTTILQSYVIEQIPIFNIFEAVCWIYTCCVGENEIVTTERQNVVTNFFSSSER